jgi:hypothetical protein
MIAAHAVAERWTLAWCLLAGAAMLAGCGGGGGGGATAPQGCMTSVSPGYAPVATGGYVDGPGDGSGGGGGGGGGDGAGAGGGLGAYVNAVVTAQRADGTTVGTATTDSYGMVTIRNCGDTQPLLITVQGTATATYWDESQLAPVPFGPGKVLHAVVVPDAPNQQTLYRNVGITPLTEAVYQYLLSVSPGGSSPPAWTIPSNVVAANARIASQISQALPPNLQVQGVDITRLAAVPRNATAQVFSGSTPNSTYGLVISGLAQAAGLHNTQSKTPGLDLLNQLAEDLSDGQLDGAKNGTPVAPSPTQAAYNVPTMTADTLGGVAAVAVTNGAAVPPVTYTSYNLGGVIGGLSAGGLVLVDGTSTVAVPSGATTFTFGAVLTSGAPYAVSVQTQPTGSTCSVANASGNAASADVGNVAVTCSTQSYTVGGTISGLTASGLILANGADTLNVAAGATSFTMPRPVASGGGYAVTVQAQPLGETCAVANGAGTMGAGNVTNVAVSCAASNYTLSGTITGLNANGLVLANGGVNVTLSANASDFTFGPVLTVGSAYAVTVQTQPVGLTCSVANGTGIAGAANVTNVAVTCSSLSYTLGGTISGLTSAGLVLTNGADTLTVAANATGFTFNKPVAYTSAYAVGVASQPAGLTCSVANGTGTMPAANVTNVAVTCSTLSYTLGGTISGLTSAGLVLANGADTLTVAANASTFVFNKPVAYTSAYAVSVVSQPTGMICSVANGIGTMPAANVANVAVTCSNLSYTVGGTIVGLIQPGLVLANGADHLTVPANAIAFTMLQPVVYGQAYAVTVLTQPLLQICVVANGSGIIGAGNIIGIVVTCV